MNSVEHYLISPTRSVVNYSFCWHFETFYVRAGSWRLLWLEGTVSGGFAAHMMRPLLGSRGC